MQQPVHRPRLLVGLAAASLIAGVLGSAVSSPAAVAADTGTAPTVRKDSLDVVGWDDQLVGESRPRLSWVVEDVDRAEHQTAYEVEVDDAAGSSVWDSGQVADERSTLRAYDGPALASGTTYTWRVRVWDDEGLASVWSDPATLRTGLLSLDDWDASWIAVPSRNRARTDFTLDEPVASAVLYLAAQGNVRARLNGAAVSDEQLGNTWTDWDQRTLYRGTDVTDLLTTGDNALALTVAATHTNDVPAINVMAQLDITAEDGTRSTVVSTGAGWRTATSPTTRVDPYRGEDADARLETAGWDQPGFDDAAWEPTSVVAPVVGAPLLSAGATVTAKDAVSCCGWSPGSVNDGVLVSTDSSQGYHSLTSTTADETKWVQLDLGSSRAIGSVALYPASPTNDPAGSNDGAGFPVRYRVEASDDPAFTDPVVIADRTGADQPNPGKAAVVLPASATGRYVRLTATTLRPSSGSYSLRLAELVVRGTDDDEGFGLSALEADPTPPMRAVDSVAPVDVATIGPTVKRYDFGQNYSGWVQISASAPAGTKVQIYLGEILDGNGRVTTSNINFADGEEQRQSYHYTFAGTGTETWEPQFVFSGFRYAEISGLPAGTDVTVRARPVHTDLQQQSELDLADPMLAGIDRAVRQSQLNAMHGLPEDTPTREKKGWTGDALSGVSSIMSAFDADDLYRKYLRDIQTSIFDDGGVASVAPSRQFGREYKVDPAWGAAYPVIAWTHYLQEGDPSVLAQHYDDLVGWVDYLATISDSDHVVVNPEVSYGNDWQASESTSPQLFQTGYYLRSVQILADAARVLGKDADATTYDGLADDIATGINKRFLNRDAASYANGTQLANAFPLLLGIVPDGLQDRVLANLVANIRSHQDHLTSGFVGTQPIIQTLHELGRDDVVLDVAERDDYPSLGYMVANGPGTIWEKWVKSSASDGTSSKDHPALGGGMEEWFYDGLAGITPLEPGYRRISLAVPDLPGRNHAAATVESPLGTVTSDWTRTGDDLDYDVRVPVGATAEVRLPAPNAASVSEGGVLLADVDGVQAVDVADGTVTVTVGSGSYAFEVTAANGRLGEILSEVEDLQSHVGTLVDSEKVSAADGATLSDGLADVHDDVTSALTATVGGGDAATPLGAALAGVQQLRTWLATSGVDGPVRSDLDHRLGDLVARLARAVTSELGVTVVLPPVAGAVLPGGSVSGAVQVTNSGTGPVTAIEGTVSVAGWGSAPLSLPTVPAGETAQLPVSFQVPRHQDPGGYAAKLTLSLTIGATSYALTDSTDDWATVSPGLQIGDVTVQVADADPPEHAVLRVPVSNTGSVDVHSHVAATLPAGWGSVPSTELVVPAGGAATAEVPVVVPLDRVGGATPVTVDVRRAGASLVSKDVTVALPLTTPPGANALDHVDFGDTTSENEHDIQAGPHSGTNSEAGLTRRYADPSYPGSWYSAEVAVPTDAPFVLRDIETFDGARTKKYNVYVDDTLVKAQLVPRTKAGVGIEVYDLLVDDPAVLDNGGDVRIKFEYPADASGFYDPSIADLWVLGVPEDTQAPDVSAMATSGTVGDAGWFRSDATVAVSAADNRDEAPAVEAGDGSTWQAYVGPVTVSGEGKHEVSYRASDEAGNASAARTLPVWIDQTAPQTTLAATRGAGVEGADSATLSFAAADALSGVAQTVYRIDGGAWATVGAGKVTVGGFGEHTVDFASTDVAGNAEMVQHQTVDLSDVDTVQAVVAPQVSGAARYGATLSATTGSWNTKGLSFGYQWLRDGSPVAGAQAGTLRLGAADVGHQLSVRVTATKAGKAPGTADSVATVRVAKATSSTRVKVNRTKVRKGKPVRVTVRVASHPGATGKVTVRVDGKKVRTVGLKHGKATMKVVVKRKGKHKIRAVYRGSSTVAGSRAAARTIRVT